jgi:hypothetical protein
MEFEALRLTKQDMEWIKMRDSKLRLFAAQCAPLFSPMIPSYLLRSPDCHRYSNKEQAKEAYGLFLKGLQRRFSPDLEKHGGENGAQSL